MRALFFLFVLLILGACNQKAGEKKSVQKKKETAILLPDVSATSVADNLTYEIKLLDSAGPGLGNITSKYCA